jgi:iron complex outermembrane receptor protein
MVYGTIAKGFRPGGGNEPLPTNGPLWANLPLNVFKYPTNQWPQTYSPDTVWNYEIGEKARFLDRRVTLNSSLYYERWNNIQLEELPNDYPLTDNNGTATIWGGEVELQAILGAGFHLGLVGGYTHASLAPSIHYTIVPNDKLSDVPPYTGDINLTYATPISPKYELEARIESNYVGRRYSLTFPPGYSTGALTQLPSYGITNIRAGILSSDGWEATVFANNVFNKQASLEYLTQLTLANPSFSRVVTNQPVTIGVDLSFKF